MARQSMEHEIGYIYGIHRGATHDGPGIRTTVSLQGCPMKCQWCNVPHARPRPKSDAQHHAKPMTVGEVMAHVVRDRAYYDASGGGLTVSGGEPTDQADFLLCLLHVAKQLGIHTCLDTCGLFAASLATYLLPIVDIFLFDYKATGPDHERLTGAKLDPILACLSTLTSGGARVILRCPMIPGVNDSEEHLAAIAKLSGTVDKVEILPYQPQNTFQPLMESNGASPVEMTQTWIRKIAIHGARNVGLG